MAVHTRSTSSKLATITDKFEKHGATDPAHAMTLEALGINAEGWFQGERLKTLIEKGFVAQHTPDTYYLKVEDFAKYRRRDLGFHVLYHAIVMLVLLIIYIVGTRQPPA